MITREDYMRCAFDGMQEFEKLQSHPMHPDGLPLAILHAKRFLWMANAVAQAAKDANAFFPGGRPDATPALVASAGCFPGTFERILKKLFNGRIRIDGVGLAISKEFREAFEGNVFERILAVELDPLHPQNLSERHPTKIDLPDASVDAFVAGEILEHLYSPLHFLKEAARVLKKDGHLILTTPNISYIGNLIKLAEGLSCCEPLPTSHIFMDSEWRAHMRVYDPREITTLCAACGPFSEMRIEHMDNGEGSFYKNPVVKMKTMLLRPFAIIPRFRNNLCLVYRKG